MAPRKNKFKLTNATIAKIESAYNWDTEIAQFGVRYFAKTKKRTFIYRYRGHNNKQREFRIGTFPAIDVARARQIARELMVKVAMGEDPQLERNLKRHEAKTYNDLIDAYLVWVASNRKERSIKEVTRFCEKYLRPMFGKLTIEELTKGATQTKYDGLKGKMKNSYRNKLYEWARTIWFWGHKRGRVEGENPFLIAKEFSPKRRKRVLGPDEFHRLWQTIERQRKHGSIGNITLNAIEFFLLTPLRKTEVFRLRWHNVDLDKNMIRVVDHKTDHRDPEIELFITTPLRELLERMPRTRTGWLFPSPSSASGHIGYIDHAWKTIREEAGIPYCTIHDMRRSWNSIGATQGNSPAAMARVIGNSAKVNEENYYLLHQQAKHDISEKVALEISSYKHGGRSVEH